MSRGIERFQVNWSPERTISNSIISGEENHEELLPIKDVAENSPLSRSRIRELLIEGKINGELRLDEGFGKGLWYTSIAEVERYKRELPSFSEYGRKGGKMAGRGRPKSSEID